MVGPGTGVAPFRAFVQERAARRRHCSGGGAGGGAGGEGEDGGGGGVGDAVLYFGCRGAACDYLYAAEWEAHLASGALRALHTAFSREGTAKVYVQHRMQEPANAAALWALLRQDDAHVYIAGASKQMPKDVRAALRQAAVEHGSLDEEAAEALLRRLEAQKRLQCETW
jgi:sulfite reductase alpha subunit-like flavoprotein